MVVHITGIGVISAIGLNVEENFNSLKSQKSGIDILKNLSFHKPIFGGEVKLTDQQLIEKYNIKTVNISRTSLLGITAAREAWGNNKHTDDLRSGIISATSVGGMDRTEKYFKELHQKNISDISLLSTHDSGNTTEKIASELNFTGYINTLSTACSSSTNSIMLGARMIEQNKLDRVLVGGADALTLFTINGFHSLMIYDTELCKPFDENRNGLNLGEGAAFLVLESEKSIKKTGNKSYCTLAGWANASDAYHQTASSPEGKGSTLAMKAALEKANLNPIQVDYINAHGTGTKNNDLSESTALINVFGERVPAFSSTKAFTGHTLAAAGAIEAVFSILALKSNTTFLNLNFTTPIAETKLIPEKQFKTESEIKVVLSNSFGFGGNNSCLIFKK